MSQLNDITEIVDRAVAQMLLEKDYGSFEMAFATVEVLKKIITFTDWKNAKELTEIIKREGRRITATLPTENVIGNMIRRILKIIREEYVSVQKSKSDDVDQHQSLHSIVTAEDINSDLSQPLPDLKEAVLNSLEELMSELETSALNIVQQALEHIHSNEIIMTVGSSNSIVEAFLKHAAKQRRFQVVVVQGTPLKEGQDLAINLSRANIETTLVADMSIFAMMSRVNKVIISTDSVLANGGLKAVVGTHAVAAVAKHYSVPVIVLAPMYNLSPQYLCSSDQEAFNQFVSPHPLVAFSEVDSDVHLCNPTYDYVPPELVTLFIANMGGHAPSYVYRLLSELYHPEDYNLQ